MSGQPTEAEGTATFPVVPLAQPSAAVRVAPGSLTFSATTWNTAQTVTVTHAVEDASSWTEFRPADDVTDDEAGLAVSPRAVTATSVADDVDAHPDGGKRQPFTYAARTTEHLTVSGMSLTIRLVIPGLTRNPACDRS